MPTVTIEFSTLIVVLFGIINLIIIGPVAWILKGVIADLKDIGKKHDELREDVYVNYLRKDEYETDLREIKEMLHGIYDKLDGKADK